MSSGMAHHAPEIGGCGKVLVPTLRNGDTVFMDEIAQPGGLQEACS